MKGVNSSIRQLYEGTGMLKTLFMILSVSTGISQDPWTVEYVTYEEGPRTTYQGTVRLRFEDHSTVCMTHCWEIPEGRLVGSAISSNPGQPMLPFDSWELTGNELRITWCRTPASNQHVPVQSPRNFKFSVIKTTFDGDDLGNLLADWGPPVVIDVPWPENNYTYVSPWDLNLDTIVDGKDLAILLGGWKVD